MEELEFSLKLLSKEVTIVLEDGKRKSFVLKELTGEQRDSYLNTLREKSIVDAEGKMTGVKDFKGFHTDLLALCLYDEDKLVKETDLKKWLASVLSKLYIMAQELSQLGKVKKEDTKNE